jgi:hypothetical protein
MRLSREYKKTSLPGCCITASIEDLLAELLAAFLTSVKKKKKKIRFEFIGSIHVLFFNQLRRIKKLYM